MKKTLYFTLIFFLWIGGPFFINLVSEKDAVALPVPNWWRGSPEEYDQLVKNAEKEGKVICYASMNEEEISIITKAFAQLYPNIKVEYTRASNLEDRERILREMRAGMLQMDVLEVSQELIPTFRQLKLLKSYNWLNNFRIDPMQPDKNNEFIKIGGNLHIIAYNTDKVSSKDTPKTWEDLLDSKWKGRKICVDVSPRGFMDLYPVWGEKKLVDYLQKLAEQQPLFKRGNTAIAQMLGAGEFHIAAGVTFKSLYRSKKKGAPVEASFPPLIGVSFEQAVVVSNAPHPNGAILFLGWLASGGQEFYDEASSGEGMPLPGNNTMQGRLIKSKDQLSIFTEDLIPKRAELDALCLKALGFKK